MVENKISQQKKSSKLWAKVKDHKLVKHVQKHVEKVKEHYHRIYGKMKLMDHQILIFIHEAELSLVLLFAVVVFGSFAGYLLFGGSENIKDEDILINATIEDQAMLDSGGGIIRNKTTQMNQDSGGGIKRSSWLQNILENIVEVF